MTWEQKSKMSLVIVVKSVTTATDANMLGTAVAEMKQVCRLDRSSLLLGRNVRWPRRMLPADGTDRRTPYRHITLSARRGQHYNIGEM